jgi:hypothetical protein
MQRSCLRAYLAGEGEIPRQYAITGARPDDLRAEM